VFPRARGFWRGLADEMTRVSVSGVCFFRCERSREKPRIVSFASCSSRQRILSKMEEEEEDGSYCGYGSCVLLWVVSWPVNVLLIDRGAMGLVGRLHFTVSLWTLEFCPYVEWSV
jgi:hypothetical protein